MSKLAGFRQIRTNLKQNQTKCLVKLFPEFEYVNIVSVALDGVGVEGGEEDELELAVTSGVVNDVVQSDLPVYRIHEHIKLVEGPKRRSHGLPHGHY